MDTVVEKKQEIKKTICYIADKKGFKINHFVIPSRYEDVLSRVLIPRGMIVDRIERMAFEILKELGSEEEIHLICILKGSRNFFNELKDCMKRIINYRRELSPRFFNHYVSLSYCQESGKEDVETIFAENLSSIEGQCTLVIEDVLNTGSTLTKFYNQLQQSSPKSIHVATLFQKRNPENIKFVPNFIGFSIPDEFVVGYGLDYNQVFRDLNHLCILNEKGIEKYRK